MKQTVLLIYEDKIENGGFARSFGVEEIEIDAAILKKHGKVLSTSTPDIFTTFLRIIEQRARGFFGI